MNNKKKITMLFLLTATAIGAYAQGNGMAGINEATKMEQAILILAQSLSMLLEPW